MTHPCTITKVPYKCSIDALVFMALLDKEKIELLNKSREITLENILSDVCMVYSEDAGKIKGLGRKTEIINCKRLFYYLARQKTPHSFKFIGEFMGGKDHTTALHHSQTVTDYLKVKEPKWMIVWEYYLENSKLFNKNDF